MIFNNKNPSLVAALAILSIIGLSAAPASAQNATLMSPTTSNQPAPAAVPVTTNWTIADAFVRGGAAGVGNGATAGSGTITFREAGGDTTSFWNGSTSAQVNSCGGTCAENSVELSGGGGVSSFGYAGMRVEGPNAASAGASSNAAGNILLQGRGFISFGTGTPPAAPALPATTAGSGQP